MIFARKHKSYSDTELIDLYKETGEAWYAGELFQRHTKLIAALAYNYLKDPIETEDAVMDVFEILLTDLKQYEVRNFKAWLYSVTKNHCLKKKRAVAKERQTKEGMVASNAPVLGMNADEEREEALLRNAHLDQLEEALQELSEEQKRCVELFFLKEKSYKEVSDITGFTMKQVKSYLQNGKRNLKGQLLRKIE